MKKNFYYNYFLEVLFENLDYLWNEGDQMMLQPAESTSH